MSGELATSSVARDGTSISVQTEAGGVRIDADGTLRTGGVAARVAPHAGGQGPAGVQPSVAAETARLTRVVHDYALGAGVSGRTTWDVHAHGAVHVHVRLRAERDVELPDLELPRIDSAPAEVEAAGGTAWAWIADGEGALAAAVKKLPWTAAWNDVGAHDHRVLAAAALAATEGGATIACPPVRLDAGRTIEAALALRPVEAGAEGRARARAEAAYDHPDEQRYVPEGEYRHGLVWESDDVWLGPPIFDGCPQRPYDQLIPRPLGLNVLARKRFTWSNEDFSLWRLTGKQRYLESGVKKAVALVHTQNEHGGWYEGIEFYNLPPRHHHMYDTYISGLFLLDAWDATGDQRFLDAALRARDFWCTSPPPANGHVEVAPGAWWYRWGGYVNEFGYTDERCVLNTHSGATAFLALLAERTGDSQAREAAARGMAAVRWGLERGIQRGDGQLMYCLSQVDPSLERPGDPPYIKLDLVPQIEDVYTVASSYRLMLANRVVRDEVVEAAIRRALDYWWRAFRAGTVYTYRAYAVLGYAVAAGELDLRYALALPELLRDPQHFTSMQRGLSAFVAPHGLPLIDVRVEGTAASFVEPVFLRRRAGELLVALVNVEQPVAGLSIRAALPAGATPAEAVRIDPAAAVLREEPLAIEADGGAMRVTVGDVGEFGVAVVALRFTEAAGG
jgi:hypothetical protein